MSWIIRMHRSWMSFLLFSTFLTASSDSLYKEFDCVVTPSNVADLGSNARGVIADVLVDRNDFLKQGEVIATLDAEVEHAMVEIAREQASIDTEIALRKVNLTYAKREEERAQSAFEEKAFSIHDLDTAKVNRELAHIKLLQAEENKLLAEKKLKEAEARLAHKTIRAPFAGVVMERFKTIGEYIDDDPVVRLAQLDPLYVEIIVPVEEENNIKVGMTANICSDRNEGRGWDVSVVQVDEVIDAASGTFGVRLLLPNPDYKIPAGLRCNLRFIEELNSIEKKNLEGVTSRHG
jgi:RND family efflux transporter MFP subunit